MLLIYGTYAKWRFLADPPDDLFLVYSHSFSLNYTIGVVIIAGFVYSIIQSLAAGR